MGRPKTVKKARDLPETVPAKRNIYLVGNIVHALCPVCGLGWQTAVGRNAECSCGIVAEAHEDHYTIVGRANITRQDS